MAASIKRNQQKILNVSIIHKVGAIKVLYSYATAADRILHLLFLAFFLTLVSIKAKQKN